MSHLTTCANLQPKITQMHLFKQRTTPGDSTIRHTETLDTTVRRHDHATQLTIVNTLHKVGRCLPYNTQSSTNFS